MFDANPSALLMQAVASLHEMGRSHGGLGAAKIRVLLRRNNTLERCTVLGLHSSKVCHGAYFPLGMSPSFAHAMSVLRCIKACASWTGMMCFCE